MPATSSWGRQVGNANCCVTMDFASDVNQARVVACSAPIYSNSLFSFNLCVVPKKWSLEPFLWKLVGRSTIFKSRFQDSVDNNVHGFKVGYRLHDQEFLFCSTQWRRIVVKVALSMLFTFVPITIRAIVQVSAAKLAPTILGCSAISTINVCVCMVTTKLVIWVMEVANTIAVSVCTIALWVEEFLRVDFNVLPSVVLIFPFNDGILHFFARMRMLTSLSKLTPPHLPPSPPRKLAWWPPSSHAYPFPYPLHCLHHHHLCHDHHYEGHYPQPVSWTCLVSCIGI